MVSAKGVLRNEGFRYSLDNGAWSSYTQGRPFDERAFDIALRQLGGCADWTVVPDIVAGGKESLSLSLRWVQRVLEGSPMGLLPVQDGITPADVSSIVGVRMGLFLGGSTEWKLRTLNQWGSYARRRGVHLHVGRVNTQCRIRRCAEAGADSFDGSSVSRFAVNVPALDEVRRAPVQALLPFAREADSW